MDCHGSLVQGTTKVVSGSGGFGRGVTENRGEGEEEEREQGTAVAAGSVPQSVTVDPSGKFVYVANVSSNNISVYAINQITGALTAGMAEAAETNPFSVTITGTIK